MAILQHNKNIRELDAEYAPGFAMLEIDRQAMKDYKLYGCKSPDGKYWKLTMNKYECSEMIDLSDVPTINETRITIK